MRARSVWATPIIVCLVFLGAGCNLQTGGDGPRTWIDAPLDGTTLPLGTFVVRSHAASDGGTAQAVLLVNGAEVRVDQAVDASSVLIEFAQAWTPPGPGDYVLQVLAVDNAGNEGPSNLVRVRIGDLIVTETPTIEGPPGIIPPTSSTPSATGVSGPTFTFDKNGNCREGPSTAYEVLTSFLAGQQARIDGRNQDNSWFWLLMPGGGHCWASVGTGLPQGPFASTDVIQPPPPPVVTTEAAPPPPPPPQAPGAPGGFNVLELQCDASKYIVRLTWQDVNGEDGYRIYRDGSIVANTSANATSYDDPSPDYSSHSYRVEAFNGSGANSTGTQSSTGCLF